MARYVMASRRAGKFHETQKRKAREAVDRTFTALPTSIEVIADFSPKDLLARRVVVFDADPRDVAAVAPEPDVLLEPEILHWPDVIAPVDLVRAQQARRAEAPAPPAAGVVLQITVLGNGQPLSGATVHLFLRGFGGLNRDLEQVTDASGQAQFSFDPFWQAAAAVVLPADAFWSVVVRGPSGNPVVECPPLPQQGPLAWWHELLGIGDFQDDRGRAIRVGVADTGCGPHANLAHAVDIGAFIDGQFHGAPAGADVDSHGSHVCGIIGARPTLPGQYAGIAPGADLYFARVFPPNRGANQGDIANAIDALSREHRVDLINLSLGSDQPSEIEHDAIRDAFERGTLCVCAAANSAGPVEWPARFEECVAVSALGREGWGPPGTLAAARLPNDPDRFGNENLYLANFSCFGPEILSAGPGVGIISTVPQRFGLQAPYAAMDGTSMASPAVCAALAVLLSRNPAYLAMPRDETRAQRAKQILRDHCRDTGLRAIYQGRGTPRIL